MRSPPRAALPAFHRRSSTQVTAAVGLTACLLVFLAAFLSARQTRYSLEAAESYHLSSINQLLADSVRTPVAFEEYKMVQETLENLAPSLPGLLWIEVTTKDGTSIGRWERVSGIRVRLDPTSVAKGALPITSPEDQEELATIEIGISRDVFDRALSSIERIGLAIMGATIFIALLMSIFLGRFQLGLEERVVARTMEVVNAKREVSDILDNMGQAIFTVGEDGVVSRESSAHCVVLFRTEAIAGRLPVELLELDPQSESRATLEGWLSTVIGADELQWRLAAGDPPSELVYRGSTIEISYAPIFEQGIVRRVMFICRDVSQVRQLAAEVQKKGEENRTLLENIGQIAALEPELLSAFLDESEELAHEMREALEVSWAGTNGRQSADTAMRALHTLKGNSRAYRLRALEQLIHTVEGDLQRWRAESDWTEARRHISESVNSVADLVDDLVRLGREVLGQRSSLAKSRSIEPIVSAASSLTQGFEVAFASIPADRRALLSELLSGVLELPLMQVSTLLPRLEGTAKDVAARLGKPAPQLDFSLDGLLMEPALIEKLSGLFIHLIRNAMDHGIEPPLQRRQQQKAERGRLSLVASVAGDRLRFQLADDGGGIDPSRVRAEALRRNLISADDPALHDDAAALALLFEPGFSTASQVTEISGRGVGLDVVRSTMQALGGDVEIRSSFGRSTTFILSLPLSSARVVPVPSLAAIAAVSPGVQRVEQRR